MARIRSVHPKLFTDDSFVSLSDAAQIFFIGLWTEADDYGAFEWKPVSLKMRIRPASSSPVEPLLEELLGAKRVLKYEFDGREYGLIRNFTKYQRPKFPKSVHFIPEQFRKFTTSGEYTTEIEIDERAAIPRKGEIPPQREEGGGNREEIKDLSSDPPPQEPPNFAEFWALYPKRHGAADRKAAVKAFLSALKRSDLKTILAGCVAYASDCAARGKINTEFVKQARTWLNADGWTETYGTEQNTQSREENIRILRA